MTDQTTISNKPPYFRTVRYTTVQTYKVILIYFL